MLFADFAAAKSLLVLVERVGALNMSLTSARNLHLPPSTSERCRFGAGISMTHFQDMYTLLGLGLLCVPAVIDRRTQYNSPYAALHILLYYTYCAYMTT